MTGDKDHRMCNLGTHVQEEKHGVVVAFMVNLVDLFLLHTYIFSLNRNAS